MFNTNYLCYRNNISLGIMISATSWSQFYRKLFTRSNLLRAFSKVIVMNDCRLAQDTFVFRQVIHTFDTIVLIINLLNYFF